MIANEISQLIQAAIKKDQKKGDLPKFDIPEIVIERPKDPTHGEYATPAALGLARYARLAPVQIAEKIIKRMAQVDYIGEVTVAHPGFINIRLAESWLAQQVETILAEGDDFGRVPPPPHLPPTGGEERGRACRSSISAPIRPARWWLAPGAMLF